MPDKHGKNKAPDETAQMRVIVNTLIHNALHDHQHDHQDQAAHIALTEGLPVAERNIEDRTDHGEHGAGSSGGNRVVSGPQLHAEGEQAAAKPAAKASAKKAASKKPAAKKRGTK